MAAIPAMRLLPVVVIPPPADACVIQTADGAAGILGPHARDSLVCASPAAMDVLAERARQVEAEGWTAEHDDAHPRGELALAAASYAQTPADRAAGRTDRSIAANAPDEWPWEESWWKPRTNRDDLVRAGALIIAEIDRLDRAAAGRAGERNANLEEV